MPPATLNTRPSINLNSSQIRPAISLNSSSLNCSLNASLNGGLSGALSGALNEGLNDSFNKTPSSLIPSEEQQSWDLDLVLKDIQLNSASQGEVGYLKFAQLES